VGLRSQLIRQRDFSAGEVVPDAKRRDDQEIVRAAVRSALNWRIEAAGNLRERPGRSALFKQEGRTETILMPGEVTFRISFGSGSLTIRDASGTVVITAGGFPWDLTTVNQVVYTVVNRDVVICFPGMKTKLARRSTAGVWSFTDFAFRTAGRGQPRAPYYRFPETAGITLLPSDRTGVVNITFSAAYLTPSHVGTFLRYKGYALQVQTYVDSTHGTAQVVEDLPLTQTLTVTSSAGFYVGDVVSGSSTSSIGEVVAVRTGPDQIDVVLNSTTYAFTTADTVVGPSAKSGISATASITPLGATVQWDEQAIGDLRGWPRSCLNDRNRLTFCDLPSVPEAILWSAVSSYDDFYVGTDASAAIFELAPGRRRVIYVTGGPDQFVFTSGGVYYIPISESNPLKPGSVAFRRISPDGVGAIQPVATTDGICFMNTGLTRVMALLQVGATNRPYSVQAITDYHSHLIKTPKCMAYASGDGQFPEQYIYLVNSDGTAAVGRVSSDKKWVGWVPWSGTGTVEWVASLGAETLFTTKYVGTNTQRLVETLDGSAIMDGQILLNSAPTPLAPPGGGLTGPLWMFAGMTVDLMDGLRDLGQRSVSSVGDIVTLAGDDFSAVTITAGLTWSQSLEPFVPHAAEGPDFEQTLKVRRVRQIGVAVRRSVGFEFGNRTIPAYDWGQDPAAVQPTPKEQTFRFRRIGRDVDPRFSLTRSRPGTITVLEVSYEVTV